MSVTDRLKNIRGQLGKSQKEMAALLGISYRTYENYEKGLNSPNWDVCESLVKLGFNANWLLTGEGEMRRGAGDRTAEPDHVGDVNKMIAADPGTPFAQDAESTELLNLLKRYGNRALIEDVKARLLKIKAVVEG